MLTRKYQRTIRVFLLSLVFVILAYENLNVRAGQTSHEHSSLVMGTIELRNGSILSWGQDSQIILWDKNGLYLNKFIGHDESLPNGIKNVIQLSNYRLLSLGVWDKQMILWSDKGELLTRFIGHTNAISGAIELYNQNILSWSVDGTIRIWDIAGNELKKVSVLEDNWVEGAIILQNTDIVVWFRDNTIQIFDINGNFLANLSGHTASITGVIQREDNHILSWGFDETIRAWGAEGNLILTLSVPQAIPPFNAYSIRGVKILNNQNILSWGDFGNYLWDKNGNIINSFGRSTLDIIELQNSYLLAREYSNVSVYDAVGNLILDFDLPEFPTINGILELQDEHILTWFNDGSIQIFNVDGTVNAHLIGHIDNVFGATQLRDGRILSWGYDTTLRLWDIEGNSLAIMGSPKSR